ncbi:hypothetical protein VP01_15g7 [Puccinia sorghi]|uniref:glutathione gamma-glutamylcysteinyltransferase n=1 Tax=Puccinia sorghi TaxID=27349 RepID=A0A0L6VHE1_9BASI|nr:hypothetical protein VP01_15g7 [Puccinia sorghi]
MPIMQYYKHAATVDHNLWCSENDLKVSMTRATCISTTSIRRTLANIKRKHLPTAQSTNINLNQLPRDTSHHRQSDIDPHSILSPYYSIPMSDNAPSKLAPEKNNVPARSFYQRQLPESCLSFTSERGKALFRSALADGHLESFFPLASQLVTQHEPSFCGLATLCTVLNALGVDPKRVWKHPWRCYSPFLDKANCLTCNPDPPSITRVNLNKSSWAILSHEMSPILESVKLEPLPTAVRKMHDYISTNLAKIPTPIEVRPGLESKATNLFEQVSCCTSLVVNGGDHQPDQPLIPLLTIFALAVLPPQPHPDPKLMFLEPELAYLRSQLNALGECCSLESDHTHPPEHRCECKKS